LLLEVHWVRDDMKLKTVKNGCNGTHSIQTTFTKSSFTSTRKWYVHCFEELQSAITEGQFAAWYEDELVGSGVIRK
jgi:tRNA-specific 2-thiouridylase